MAKELHTKICLNCKKEFTTNKSFVKYCCKDCQYEDMMRQRVEKKRIDSIKKYKDNPEAKTCKLCGFMAMDLTPHITLGHKITVKEYCEKFECTPESLISKQANANRSKGQKESTHPNKKRFTSENNPGKGHGGKFSPYSKNFLKYEGMSDKEKEEKINEVIENTNHSVESRTTHIAYYTSRGMNEEQAKEALRQRQQTFSKEICIEKYGEEKGLERFKERQLQWEKNFPKSNYSLVSQKLFKAIDEKLDLSKFTTYYATKGEKYNNEYIIHLKDSFCKADYYVEELKCIIEFDGDYWHGEARGNQERDKERDQKLKDLGYKILHIQERKYKESPQEVVDACVAYINFLVQDKS